MMTWAIAMYACSPESQAYPGLQKKKQDQQLKGASIPLLMRPHLEHCIQPWGPQHSKDTALVQQGLRRPQRWSESRSPSPVRCLWGKAGVFQTEDEKAPGRPYCSLLVLEGAFIKGHKHFSRACSYRTGSNGLKCNECWFRLHIRKKFFTMRVVQHWHRLPRAWQMLHPWEHLRWGWVGFWATWYSNLPVLQGNWATRPFKSHYQFKQCYDSVLFLFNATGLHTNRLKCSCADLFAHDTVAFAFPPLFFIILLFLFFFCCVFC